MRNLHEIDRFRISGREHYGWDGDGTCGMFSVPSVIDNSPLKIIASIGEGWEHVSVSRPNRCPNWPEMEQVKRLFFLDHETAMQLHVPVSDHISHHPYCLHIWRPLEGEIPRPPASHVA